VKTIIELAQQFNVHPNHIAQWRNQILEELRAFSTARRRPERRPRHST
jgi:transposase-like protein